ncbi:alpha/beta fold hydrolase [Roseovarius aestuariivivens]|uniref:alpha/beta fold hydrolase n=1 Tax=Roseovarius aestuariivivens TaxID=1888910 RepID=UPI00108094CA|nr:alpha/beta fold hydrolase [Roseovarius aestuariivivens]
MIVWGFAAAALAILVWPFLIESIRPRMRDKDRALAPGAFAVLPKGVTHYRWLGAEDGPLVVCVHGLTTPSFVWEPIAQHLGEMGFRVLVYDLYGRGYSDRPKGLQDADFFCDQLDALLDELRIDEPFTLFGYSMGGAIATAYAARHPAKIRELVLIAPAGLGHDLGPVADLAVNQDWIGKWLALGFYPRVLRRATEADRALPSAIPDMVDRQILETRWRGFAPAVLSSLRGIMSEDLAPAHAAIAKTGVPVLAIWGKEDDVIPIAGLGKLAEWNRDARQEEFEDAGHALAYTHVNEIAEVLAGLRRN